MPVLIADGDVFVLDGIEQSARGAILTISDGRRIPLDMPRQTAARLTMAWRCRAVSDLHIRSKTPLGFLPP